MPEDGIVKPNQDPTLNVRELITDAVDRLDDLRDAEARRVDEKFVGIVSAAAQRFEAQQLALKDALISQEKAVAAALEGTKEAINKADINTDKRFSLLSEKIDGITNTMNKSTGERGIYVTHVDLNIAMDKLQQSIETTLRPVVNFMNSSQGTGKGRQDMYGWIVGGVMFVITVAGFAIAQLT